MSRTPKSRFPGLFVFVGVSLWGLILGAPPAFAQFNFQNFSSTAGLTLNGSAVRAGSVLRLTPATGSKAGSAWFSTQQVVSNGFTTAFQFRISNPSVPPADGIAFVIQNSSLTALGNNDGGIGYAGITDSLAVEFDTFKNSENNDPDANHVAVQSCGTSANTAVHFGSYPNPNCTYGLRSITSPTFADGSVHTVAINYDPTPPSDSFCEGAAALTIYLDSSTPVLTACFFSEGGLASLLGLGDSQSAWVGFTGATGVDFERQDILNWSFTPHNGATTNAILTFNPGTNVSQVATFNCPSNTVPCTDPEAHSIKLTASKVFQTFSLVVSATTVDGTGSCASGNPNDNAHFDCRFVTHFGVPSGSPPAVTVPLCDPYTEDTFGTLHCVYYRIENPPATFKYAGPIYWYIALNDDSFVTGGTCATTTNPVNLVPTGYQCDNRQLADDPDSPPHPADANQFVTYITTYFNGNGGQVGFDPGIGGTTKHFNDVAVVFPLVVPSSTFTWVWPSPFLPGITYDSDDLIPVIFLLTQGNNFVTNAVTPPNAVGIAVLNSNGVRQPVKAPDGSLPVFVYLPFFNVYALLLSASPYPSGTYQLEVNSNLFTQQTASFVMK